MIKERIVYTLLLIFCYNSLNAQDKIEGTYNPDLHIFETEDKTYWIDFFEHGVAKIHKDELFGLIDTTGTIICLPKYSHIFSFNGGKVAVVCKEGKQGLINRKGEEILEPQFYFIDNFSCGVAWFKLDEGSYWGLLNDKGEIIIDPKYRKVCRFHNDYAYCYDSDSRGRMVIISKEGNIIYNATPVFASLREQDNTDTKLYGVYNEDYYPWLDIGFTVQERIAEWGMMYTKQELSRLTHKTLYHFSEGLALVVQYKNNQIVFGYIDNSGNISIPVIYEDGHNFVNGFACVRKGKKWGVIDRKGRQVLPFRYESLQSTKGDFFIFSKNGKYGVISKTGKELISAKYLEIKYLFTSCFALLDMRERISNTDIEITPFTELPSWGVIDAYTQNMILPFKYDKVLKVNDVFGIGVSYQIQELSDGYRSEIERSLLQGSTSSLPFRNFKITATRQVFDSKKTHQSYQSVPLSIKDTSVGENHLKSLSLYHQKGKYYNFLSAFLDDKGQEVQGKNAEKLLEKHSTNIISRWLWTPILLNSPEKVLEWHFPECIQNYNVDIKCCTFSIVSYLPLHFFPGRWGVIIKKEELYGYYDFYGKELLKIIYEHIEETEDGYLKVTLNNETFLMDRKGNKIND